MCFLTPRDSTFKRYSFRGEGQLQLSTFAEINPPKVYDFSKFKKNPSQNRPSYLALSALSGFLKGYAERKGAIKQQRSATVPAYEDLETATYANSYQRTQMGQFGSDPVTHRPSYSKYIWGRQDSPAYLCPDGSYVYQGPCTLCPDGSYIGSGGECQLTP